MKKSIAKNMIFKFLLNLFNLIVPILIGPYVLRKLGPELMGEINFAQSIFGYFFIFASFGVYQYGLREISRVRDNKEKLSQTFTSLFLVTVITTIITTISYVVFVYYKFGGTEVYVACMVLTFNLLANTFYTEWVVEALEDYDFITIKTIVIRVIYIILLFLMVRSSNDFEEYLFLLVLSTVLNNIVSYFYIKKRIKFNFKKIRIIRHLKPMFLVVILSNANVLYTQLDRLMLGEYISTVSVAYYAMAQNISTIVNTLMLTVIHVTIPRLSNYLANDSDKKYISLLNKISKMYFMLLFPASIGMALLAKEVVIIYGGNEYLPAIPMVAAFSIYIITLGYEVILSNQVMYIKREEKRQVQIIFLGGGLNLIINILLLKFNIFNGTTAILTTMLSNIIVIILEVIYIRIKLKLQFNIFGLDKSKYLLISLLFIPVTYLIRSFITNLIIFTLLTMLVNAILYGGILYIIKDETFIDFINKSLYKLKIKKQ